MEKWMHQHLGGSQLLALQHVQLADVNAVVFPWQPFDVHRQHQPRLVHVTILSTLSDMAQSGNMAQVWECSDALYTWSQGSPVFELDKGHVSNGPQGKARPPQLLIVCFCAANRHWLPVHHDEHHCWSTRCTMPWQCTLQQLRTPALPFKWSSVGVVACLTILGSGLMQTHAAKQGGCSVSQNCMTVVQHTTADGLYLPKRRWERAQRVTCSVFGGQSVKLGPKAGIT